jgi:hypothetical protein
MQRNDALTLLETDWNALESDKNWPDLGKCLRAMIKVQKNAGQLSHSAYEIGQRIKVLEENLNAVDPKTRFSIVGDIIYARRAINASATTEFGTAFQGKRK